MTMTERSWQKLSLNFGQQKQSGWYLSRLTAYPSMRSHGRFNRIVREQGYRCFNCGVVNPFLTIDHIVPTTKGGTSDLDNLQLLCLIHHRNKDSALKKVRRSKEKINVTNPIQ